MIRYVVAGTAAMLAVSPFAAQADPPFDAKRLSRHIEILASDAFEGRGPATPGETKTVEYLVREFSAAGLQPGGDLKDGKRSWTQAVPLLRSEITGSPRLTLTNGTATTALTQGEEISVRSPMNGASRIDIANAPLLFVGYGTTAPERGWDDYKGVDVKGKILVMLVNDPDFEGGEGDFGGKAMTYYGRWTYKFEEAAKLGAAGVMLIHETEPASYGWATVKNSNTNVMFDIVRANAAAAHVPMESWIQRDLAAQLMQQSGTTLDAVKAAARRKDFQPIALTPRFSAAVAAKTETITAYNVAAILPGKRRPDEFVVYTAHHDHLGIGQPDANGDRIFNGAIDNATGISHLIEQARAFARAPRTDRSILFLAVGAEEKGLLGSEYYVANPLYPLGKTAGVINTDGGNVFGPARDFGISGSARLELLDRLIAEGARRGRRYVPERNVGAGYFFRSDHFPFAKRGVPAISFRRGEDLVEGGTARGKAIDDDYRAKRYHQPDDEWDANWDYRGMIDDSQMLHAVGRDLANSADWPNWSSDSEFRAVRDQSAPDRSHAAPLPSGERG